MLIVNLVLSIKSAIMGFMAEFFLSVPDILSSWGLTVESVAPVALVFFIGGFFLWLGFLRQLRSDMASARECLTDVNYASREMQKKVQDVILKIKGMDEWKPLHSLPEKLAWSKGNSPLDLNEDGKQLFDRSNVGSFVESKKNELISKIEAKNPKTRYDVQEMSFGILSEYIREHEEDITKIKEFIYENPQINGKETSIPAVIFVGSLELRDLYLQLHKDLK